MQLVTLSLYTLLTGFVCAWNAFRRFFNVSALSSLRCTRGSPVWSSRPGTCSSTSSRSSRGGALVDNVHRCRCMFSRATAAALPVCIGPVVANKLPAPTPTPLLKCHSPLPTISLKTHLVLQTAHGRWAHSRDKRNYNRLPCLLCAWNPVRHPYCATVLDDTQHTFGGASFLWYLRPLPGLLQRPV